jgi:IS1 family transposase
VAFLKWIRAAAEWIQAYHEQDKAQQRPAVEVIELDEMCHYVGSKKKLWVWLALKRGRGSILGFVTGSREASTGKKLWRAIKDIVCRTYAIDHWPAYQQFVDSHKHKVSKK